MVDTQTDNNDRLVSGMSFETHYSADQSEPELPAPQSFILKVWLVQDRLDMCPVWHGRLTHIPTGHRIHVRNMFQVVVFIAEYLDAMGARQPIIWRMYRWLRRFRQNTGRP
jgi:hypothetical protein